MATVREMITKFSFQADTNPLENIEKRLDQIKSRLEFLAAAEVVKGLFELGEKFSEFGEGIHLAAQSAGVGVEAFQELSYAAKKSGVSQDEMGAALYRLNRKLYEAKTGNAEALKSFAQAGITGSQLQSFKSAGDAMGALSDKFKAFNDPSKSAAIGTELMGRGSQRMVLFLQQGSGAMKDAGAEAKKLGGVLSDKQVESLVNMQHAFIKLWEVVKGFGATIATYLAPEITAFIDDITKFYAANQKVIQTNIKEWIGDFAYGLGFLMGVLKVVLTVFFQWIKAHEDIASGVLKVVGSFFALTIALLIASKGIEMVKGAWNLWMGVIKAPFTIIGKIKEFIAVLEKYGVIQKIVSYAGMAWNTVLGIMNMQIAFFEAPLWAVIGAIGVLVLGIQALWTVLTGGKFEDTWIGKMAGGIGNLAKGIGGGLLKMFGIGGSEETTNEQGDNSAPSSNAKPGFLQKAVGAMIPGVQKSSITDMAQQAQSSLGALAPSYPGSISSPQQVQGDVNTFNYSLNPNINITVPQGTKHEDVSKAVQNGVKEHLDRVQREAQRSLLSPIKH